MRSFDKLTFLKVCKYLELLQSNIWHTGCTVFGHEHGDTPKPARTKESKMNLEITLSMIEIHGSIADAIEAACDGHDTLTSGVVGSSFSTSGPGAGWLAQHDVTDYAERALEGEDGACGYIDSSDGRLATLDDGEIVWTEETVVEVIDDLEEVSVDTMELLVAAIESGHVVSDVSTRCTCSSCGCEELATHYDSDAGDRVCEDCIDYVCDEDGEVFCSRREETEYAWDGDRKYLRLAPPEMPKEDPEGEWACYWGTVGDDDHVVSRHSSREEAKQAVEAKDWPPPGDHTQYLCGYGVRHLVDDEWILEDED